MRLILLLCSILVIFPQIGQAKKATTCKELEKLTLQQVANGGATYAAYQDCKNRGWDPEGKFQKFGGTRAIAAPTGNNLKHSPCRSGSEEECPNTKREYCSDTNGCEKPGYDPSENKDLEKPVTPWGDVDDMDLPCGAVADFAGSALEKLLGKAQVKIPAIAQLDDAKTQINELNYLLRSLQSGRSIPQAELDRRLADINKGLGGVIGNIPLAGGAVKGQLEKQLGNVNKAIGDYANKGGATPQADAKAALDAATAQLGQMQGLLNQARGHIETAQSTIGGVVGDLKKGINEKLTGLIGDFFKYKNCEGGKFWGIMDKVFTLAAGQGKAQFDVSNSTFITSDKAYVTTPMGTKITVNLTSGKGQAFRLPNGASFKDAQGYQVRIGEGVTTQFRRDGLIYTSNGDRYRIDPRNATFDPHGIIEFPKGTRIPIPRDSRGRPQGKIYPVSSMTEYPDWMEKR